jgi:transposase-like protein
MTGRSGKYPPELRERAVRMVAEIRGDHNSEWAAIGAVAPMLGVRVRRLGENADSGHPFS